MAKIHPVVLSGGVGTRLWPESRAMLPKQFLPLLSDKTMLQETAARVMKSDMFAPVIVVANEDHRFYVASQLQEIGSDVDAIILEPFGRNSAPAAIIAALHVQASDPDGLLLILSSDHYFENVDRFHEVTQIAADAAQKGALATFGIEPTGPETGFGYIKAVDETSVAGAFDVAAFVEKPEHDVAERMLGEGNHFWNAGIFLFSASSILGEAASFCPKMLEKCEEAYEKGAKSEDFLRLDRDAFDACPSDSIDYAIMEHTKKAVTVPSDFGWSDIGSWSALWGVGDRDGDGNVLEGDVIAHDTSTTLIRSENMLVTTVGVKDLVVVQTKDAVLVADKEKVQDVKTIVDQLKKAGRTEHEIHKRVYRPWGFYEGLHEGEGRQVKHICVYPGASLSLQYHHQRSEHWTVVGGVADVQVGEEVKRLEVDGSVYIPVTAKHRLTNPADEPMHLIEVQVGDYLGEDDIVRLDDIYGRVES